MSSHKRPEFTVTYKGEHDQETTTRVACTIQDQMIGEQKANQMGLKPTENKLTYAGLMIWSALRRTGGIAVQVKAEQFLNDVLVDLDDPGTGADVDPTQPDRGSDSP